MTLQKTSKSSLKVLPAKFLRSLMKVEVIKKQSRCSLILLLIPTLIDVIGRAFHSLSVINDTIVVCGGLKTPKYCTGCFF